MRLIAERVLRAAGLDVEKDVDASPEGIGDTPQALREGRIDAFFWSGGLTTQAVRKLSKEHEIRLLPLSSLIDRLHHGGGSASYYRTAVMPADAYPLAQRGSDVPTLAVANILVTTDRMDDDLAERITRTVIGSRDHIGAQVHAAQLVDVRTAIYTDPLELHDGARRYFRSVKP
ncbi:TAXI family TRAP transporter solute-binding subunit [Actinomadura keratinilytica]